MTKSNVLQSLARANVVVTSAVIAAASLLPALMLSSPASGAQLGDRFIDMSANQTSEGSGRVGTAPGGAGDDVTYRVSFELSSAHTDLDAIIIDFCSNSPIVGDTCTAPAGFNLDDANLAFTEVSTELNANWAIDTTFSNANTLLLTDPVGTGDAMAGTETIIFDLGSAAADDGITNPSDPGTFYARIVTYDDDTIADGYTDTDPDVDGAHIDDGGIALSVTNELTITARVQEVLQFCIGTEVDSATAGFTGIAGDDCSDIDGTDIDLGVVDSNSVQRTSDVDIANNGYAMIRTNALNGAVMYYKAEQEAGLSNGGAGTLRQAGLDDCTTIASVGNGCFNSAGGDITNPAQSAIAAGTELFGMTLTNLSTAAGGATANLSCDAAYDGDDSCGAGAAVGYAWDPTGAFDTIATSSGPADDEMVQIEFAATASPTTPTGLYTVTANFVATATF